MRGGMMVCRHMNLLAGKMYATRTGSVDADVRRKRTIESPHFTTYMVVIGVLALSVPIYTHEHTQRHTHTHKHTHINTHKHTHTNTHT